MADLLFVTQSCYSKIENGVSGLNAEILIKIVSIFKEKAEKILYSDEFPILLKLENTSIS